MTTTVSRERLLPEAPARAASTPRTLLGLSVPGLLAGAGASVTAAMLGSQLGVAGTLVGAAVSSLVAAVAGALYAAGLERTHQGLRIIVTRRPRESVDGVPSADAAEATVAVATPVTSGRRRWAVAGWLVAAAVMFALALVVITGIEAGAGRTLSGQPGTSVGRVTQTAPQVAAEPPVVVAPAPASASPSAPSVPSAPTSAEPAPAASQPAATPTGGASQTPAPTPTATFTTAPEGVGASQGADVSQR